MANKQIHEITPLTGTLENSDLIMIERSTGRDAQYKSYSATVRQMSQAGQSLDAVWPVGSVYIGIQDTVPFNGVWRKIGSGRCLWGADDTHRAGTTIEAGLPAIEGSVTGLTTSESGDHTHKFEYGYVGNPIAVSGPGGFFLRGQSAAYTDSSGSHSHSITGDIKITGTGVYGRSSTVQPPALAVNIWIREG